MLTILVVALSAMDQTSRLWGDGTEYAATLMAWLHHRSPDLRPEDFASIPQVFAPVGYGAVHPNELITSKGGRTYSLHFWFYPLLCAPAALLLRAIGADPLIAFPATNAALFVGIVALGALWPRKVSWRDAMMIALAAVSPVVRYLPIAHPETFTWAFVLASLVALNHDRYGVAVALAAAAAMQNPPVVCLAAYGVVLALKARGWRGAIVPSAAGALAMIPPVFALIAFGHPNPVTERGFVDIHAVTAGRAWSLFADLDQGLVMYVPGLLILSVFSVWRGHSLRQLGMIATLMLVIAGAATNTTWNCSLPGMMRYAVWMVPIVAWLATESLPAARGTRIAIALALAVQALRLLTPPTDAYNHGRLASYALARWSSWYHPEAEIFAVRLLATPYEDWRARLPLGFKGDHGTISQVLVDAAHLPQLDRVFSVDPQFLARVKADSSSMSAPSYLDPPAGAVRSRCPANEAARQFQRDIRVQLVSVPEQIMERPFDVVVDVANDGDQPICNLGAGGNSPFNLTFQINRGGRLVAGSGLRTRGPQIVLPGESIRQNVALVLPEETGRYTITVLPVLENVTFGIRGARLLVDVRTADPGRYLAVAVPQPSPGAL